MTRFLFGSSNRRRILCTRNGQERYHARADSKKRGVCSSYNVFSDGVFAEDDISQVPCKTTNLGRLPRGRIPVTMAGPAHAELQRRQQEEIELQVPLESGRTTDTNLAPQLVTLTEKSPTLSSYTPAAALASSAPVDCAPSMDAARHRVARSSWRWLRLAMAGQSTRGCSCLRTCGGRAATSDRPIYRDGYACASTRRACMVWNPGRL